MARGGDRRGLALLLGSAIAILVVRIAGWLWQRVLAARLEALDIAGEDFARAVQDIVSLMRWGGAAQVIALAAAFAVGALAAARLGGRRAGVAAAALAVAVAALLAQCFALVMGHEAVSPETWAAIWSATSVAEQIAVVTALLCMLAALHEGAARSGRHLALGLSAGAGALAVLHAVLPLAMAIAPDTTAALVTGDAGSAWVAASFAAAVGAYALLAWQIHSARRDAENDDEPAALGHGPRWQRAATGLRLAATALVARVLFGVVSLSVASLGTLAGSSFVLEVGQLALPAGGALTAIALAVAAVRTGGLPEPRDARLAAGAAAVIFGAVAAGEIYGAIWTAELVAGSDARHAGSLVAADTTLQVAALLGTLLVALIAARLGERLGELDRARRCQRLLAPIALVFGALALLRIALVSQLSTPLATPSSLLLGFAAAATAAMSLAVALARHLRSAACAIDHRLAGGAVPEARATITEPRE